MKAMTFKEWREKNPGDDGTFEGWWRMEGSGYPTYTMDDWMRIAEAAWNRGREVGASDK